MTMDDDMTDPFARLQASDPAGPDPDLSALRARILDERVVDDRAAGPDTTVVPMRQRRGWLLPAAAGVVAIALAGSALAGYSAGRDGATVVASPPQVAAAKSDGAALEAEAMTLAPNAPAPDAPAPDAPVSDASMLAMPSVWIASGRVPDSPSVGTGYRAVRDGIDPNALAAELANALGVIGPVTPQSGGWVVGAADASAPTLWVSDDALLSWSFSDPAPIEGTTPMDADAALTVARALLRSIGVPMDTVEWQVMQVDATTTVTAWHTLGGVRSQLAWTVTLAPDGRIVGATGFAAALQPIPGYELVGAASAIDRISTPGWSALAPSPLTPGSAAASPTAPPFAGAPLMNGRPTLTVPVGTVTVTGSTIGLATYRQPDGALLVLPSYVLTDETGATWSLLAVADRYVRFSAPTASGDIAAQ